MDTVWAYVEYGWNLNPQIGLKTAESGAHNPIGIDLSGTSLLERR